MFPSKGTNKYNLDCQSIQIQSGQRPIPFHMQELWGLEGTPLFWNSVSSKTFAPPAQILQAHNAACPLQAVLRNFIAVYCSFNSSISPFFETPQKTFPSALPILMINCRIVNWSPRWPGPLAPQFALAKEIYKLKAEKDILASFTFTFHTFIYLANAGCPKMQVCHHMIWWSPRSAT